MNPSIISFVYMHIFCTRTFIFFHFFAANLQLWLHPLHLVPSYLIDSFKISPFGLLQRERFIFVECSSSAFNETSSISAAVKIAALVSNHSLKAFLSLHTFNDCRFTPRKHEFSRFWGGSIPVKFQPLLGKSAKLTFPTRFPITLLFKLNPRF